MVPPSVIPASPGGGGSPVCSELPWLHAGSHMASGAATAITAARFFQIFIRFLPKDRPDLEGERGLRPIRGGNLGALSRRGQWGQPASAVNA